MDKLMIAVFIGKHLEKAEHISATSVSNFIAKDESVGKHIDIMEIETVLSLLVEAAYLEIFQSDPVNTIYRRFITSGEIKKIRNGVTVNW